MGDSTGVSASLGGEIFSGGKKCHESNIGDSDNTGDGGKIVGGAIRACGGIEIENLRIRKVSKGVLFRTVRNGVQDLLALGSWILGTLEASLNLLLLLGNG
ncbi:hypothetical protein Tco_0396949 [Tanacetum coccineum]